MRSAFDEPKLIWFHGTWWRFDSPASREEFITHMNPDEKREHTRKTGEYIC